MIRISLDVSAGTFSKIEAICEEGFQNKVSYLRMLINEDIAKRRETSEKRRD